MTNVDPGKRMSLRDLLLGREISVHERQASTTLRKGSIIYSRIIAMDDNSIMVGCAPTVIPPNYLNRFIDIRENMAKEFPNFNQDFLLEYDTELRRIYYDIREELYNPALPKLYNTDGDPLQSESARKQSEELQAIPEIQEQLQKMAEQHWKAWLDTPLPALKEQTPNEAAKTTLGRERVEALLYNLSSVMNRHSRSARMWRHCGGR